MGMESPDNRRKADDSYRTLCVGRSLFLPAASTNGDAHGKASKHTTSQRTRNRDLDRRLLLGDRRLRLAAQCRHWFPHPARRVRRGDRRPRMVAQEEIVNLALIAAVAAGGALGS